MMISRILAPRFDPAHLAKLCVLCNQVADADEHEQASGFEGITVVRFVSFKDDVKLEYDVDDSPVKV